MRVSQNILIQRLGWGWIQDHRHAASRRQFHCGADCLHRSFQLCHQDVGAADGVASREYVRGREQSIGTGRHRDAVFSVSIDEYQGHPGGRTRIFEHVMNIDSI